MRYLAHRKHLGNLNSLDLNPKISILISRSQTRYQQLQQARASLEQRIEGYKDKKRVAGKYQEEAHKRVERGMGGKGVREG